MAGVTADAAVAVVERIAAAPLPRQDRSELVGVLILLAGLRVPRAALAEARSVRDESEQRANDRHEQKCGKRSEFVLFIPGWSEIVDIARPWWCEPRRI